MSATLSLSCSRKIYELLGDTYETEKHHSIWRGETVLDIETGSIPAPSFSETIRLLPKIAEKKGWEDYECALFLYDVYPLYVYTATEEEGMAKVSEYLEKTL